VESGVEHDRTTACNAALAIDYDNDSRATTRLRADTQPGRLVVEMTDGTREYKRQTTLTMFYDSRRTRS